MAFKYCFLVFAVCILQAQCMRIDLPSIVYQSVAVTQANLSAMQAPGNYRELMFDQTLDHFNFNDERTFQQRFLLHDEHFDPDGGVILFYAGSQENIMQSWNHDLFLAENAARFKGLVAFVEHRYYGKSMPFGNRSLDVANIAHLNVEQALMDYVKVINYLQDTYRVNSNDPNYPVIVFGGAYGGLLAAQLRLKYPTVVDGAISSAAPMNLVSGLSSPNVFYREITKAYNRQPNCVALIRTSFDLVSLWFKNPPAANNTLVQKLRLCRPIANNADYRQLVLFIRSGISKLAVYNYPYASSASGSALPANPIKTACDLMMLNSRDPLAGIKEVVSLFYNASITGTNNCFDIFNEFVECSDSTGCASNQNSIAFDYQSCVEMPILQDSNSLTDMFPSLSFSSQNRRDYCKRRWNVTLREGQFWNKKVSKAVTNLLFTDSTNDPWQSLGVDSSFGDSINTIKINEGAHRIDMKGSNPNDPTGVRVARLEAIQHIAKWINEVKQYRK